MSITFQGSATTHPQQGVGLVLAPEPWTRKALCMQTDPDAFFPEDGEKADKAKKVCAKCPVREQCEEYAIRTGQTEGVWGGLSARQLRRRRTGG